MGFEELSDALKALSDPTRLRIIALLKVRECCVCELTPLFGISQPAISKHLSRLKVSGFVTERRKGQWVYYSLNPSKLDAVSLALNQLPDVSSELKKLGSACCE